MDRHLNFNRDRDYALADIDRVLATQPANSSRGAVVGTAALFQACVYRNAPPGSTYRAQADRFAAAPARRQNSGDPDPANALYHVLSALRADIETGALATFEELVRADVFGDLVAQADALESDRYSRAAAVLAGAALEERLRSLATKHRIDLRKPDGKWKEASELNSDLKRARAYGEPQRAIVESWQELRNEAAHGKPGFEAPDTSLVAQVAPMITGVRAFIAQYPA